MMLLKGVAYLHGKSIMHRVSKITIVKITLPMADSENFNRVAIIIYLFITLSTRLDFISVDITG